MAMRIVWVPYLRAEREGGEPEKEKCKGVVLHVLDIEQCSS